MLRSLRALDTVLLVFGVASLAACSGSLAAEDGASTNNGVTGLPAPGAGTSEPTLPVPHVAPHVAPPSVAEVGASCGDGTVPYTSLQDFPIDATCAAAPGDVFAEYDAGSIRLFWVTSDGCGTFAYFDAQTGAFQGSLGGCGTEPMTCTARVGDFQFPTASPEGGAWLCSHVQANGAFGAPPIPPSQCVANPVEGYDRSCVVDSDCVGIVAGVVCEGAANCPTYAVNKSEASRYDAIVAGVGAATIVHPPSWCRDELAGVGCMSGTCAVLENMY
jgi:hypothetical protein